MADDLVKRLRQLGDRNGLMYADYDTTVEAADRIEKLESALQFYICGCDVICADFKNIAVCGYNARKALEGKDD